VWLVRGTAGSLLSWSFVLRCPRRSSNRSAVRNPAATIATCPRASTSPTCSQRRSGSVSRNDSWCTAAHVAHRRWSMVSVVRSSGASDAPLTTTGERDAQLRRFVRIVRTRGAGPVRSACSGWPRPCTPVHVRTPIARGGRVAVDVQSLVAGGGQGPMSTDDRDGGPGRHTGGPGRHTGWPGGRGGTSTRVRPSRRGVGRGLFHE